MAEAEVAQRAQWRASAVVFRSIDAALREAVEYPGVFVPAGLAGRDVVEFAVRAAVADLAVRLSLSESAVRSQGQTGRSLRERLPQLWAWFGEGEVSTQNAVEAAGLVLDLPQQYWAEFDACLLGPAKTLAPARFKARARALRERLFAQDAAERHQRAVAARAVWSEHGRDGMGWLTAHLSSTDIAVAQARIDGLAFELSKAADETRTMAQLRADVIADLLTGRHNPANSVGVTVALTVPVLSLLGASDQPAILEGVGPIDLDTARTLAADAPTLTRLLTHPVTGVVLAMDQHQYRPSKALKRWLAIRDVTCTFPGCGRRAATCDLDHITDWAKGGTTTADNLAHLCRKHHTIKHNTRWHVQRHDDTSHWTSPTGHPRTNDPPPF
ncbi:HNH endonuclease signature motif containing protein [soil metagenome]